MRGYKKLLAIACAVALIGVAFAVHTRTAAALDEQSVRCSVGKDVGRFVTAGIYQAAIGQSMYMVFEDKTGRITIVKDCNGFIWSVKRTEGNSVSVP
jgi:hypothetical protein